MNNVVRLFDRDNVETIPYESRRIMTALTDILAANAELDQAVKELLKQFNFIEDAIASIDDAGTRIRLMQSAELSRRSLLRAMLQLTRELRRLVDCPRRLIPLLAQPTVKEGQSMFALPVHSEISLSRYCPRVIDHNTKTLGRTFDLGIPEKDLNRSEITRPPIGQGGFCSSQ